jgi:hypothetical protein
MITCHHHWHFQAEHYGHVHRLVHLWINRISLSYHTNNKGRRMGMNVMNTKEWFHIVGIKTFPASLYTAQK